MRFVNGLRLRRLRSARLGRSSAGRTSRRAGALGLLVWLAALGGCAKTVVWSECPRPNPTEEADLIRLLDQEPASPASGWIARVLGEIYSVDLQEVRDGK